MSTYLNLQSETDLETAKAMLIDCFFAEIEVLKGSGDPVLYTVAVEETKSVLSDFRKKSKITEGELAYVVRECYKSAAKAYEDYCDALESDYGEEIWEK